MTAGGHNDGWRGRWPGRVLRFPLTRIVLGFLAIIVANLGRVLAGPQGSRAMMEHRGYLGKVDVEGDRLYGTVVNLHRDHVDFRGSTVDEVRQAFQDSVDFYLDGCRKNGEEPEKPFSGKFVVRLSLTTHRRASTLARVRDQSLNTVVVEALEEYLSAQGV